MVARIHIPDSQIGEFCKKHGVSELSLFGSVLRDDFGPASDVDVLVAFEPGRAIALDEWLDMLDELREMFGREVDLVERKRVTNPFRRHSILTSRQVIYAT